MKKLFIGLLTLGSISVYASAGSNFDCKNVKNYDDIVSLMIKQNGKWHMNDVNGGYAGDKKSGEKHGSFLLFKGPESTVSRGDVSDDVKIESSLFKRSSQSGTLLIIWADEDGVYHTDKLACTKV